MKKSRVPFELGDVIGIPLSPDRKIWSAGVPVAWTPGLTFGKRVILWYGIGKQWKHIPTSDDVERLNPTDAICFCLSGDRGITDGHWPVVGKVAEFSHKKWPVPVFRAEQDDPDEDEKWNPLSVRVMETHASAFLVPSQYIQPHEKSLIPYTLGASSSSGLAFDLKLAFKKHERTYFKVTREALDLWNRIYRQLEKEGKLAEIAKTGVHYKRQK